MVAQAAALGLAGIGIADRNTVAGVVRAHVALKDLRESHAAPEGFRLVVGARLVFADGTPDMLAYPQTRLGWGRLTSLLTRGNRAGEGRLHPASGRSGGASGRDADCGAAA
jgi:error-prone DNA polymerase